MKSVKINVSLASIYEGLQAGLPGPGEFTGVQLSKDKQTLEIVYSSEEIKHSYDFPVDVDDYRTMAAGGKKQSPVTAAPVTIETVPVVQAPAAAAQQNHSVPENDSKPVKISPKKAKA